MFKLVFKNFLHFANEQLQQSEQSVLESGHDGSKDQAQVNFDRITSSVLQALAHSFTFTESWAEEDKK